MNELHLEAEVRAGSGKSVTRKLRTAGNVPGILYGLEDKPVMLGINSRTLHKLLHSSTSENILVDLAVGKSKSVKVLLKDVQHHPVTNKVVHVDFQRIDLTKKIVIAVPVHLVGVADGVRSGGGVQEFIMRELEVSCLPSDIPSFIEVDVTKLGIGDAVHVGDLKLDKAEIVTDAARTIVSVQPPTVVKLPEAAEGAEGVVAEATEAAEPEVISEKKSEERQKEKEDKDKKK
jgi:large subunit ribosomal protein L25